MQHAELANKIMDVIMKNQANSPINIADILNEDYKLVKAILDEIMENYSEWFTKGPLPVGDHPYKVAIKENRIDEIESFLKNGGFLNE